MSTHTVTTGAVRSLSRRRTARPPVPRSLTRLAGLVLGAVAFMVASATAALAQVPVPDVNAASVPGSLTATTQSAAVPPASTGLAGWAVVLIAVLAVAVGAGLAELVRATRHHDRSTLASA
jgi:hypothetical protein